MYQNRGAAWIGFEESLKTINAIKEEVQLAEKKIFYGKRTLNLITRDVPLKKVTDPVICDISNKADSSRPFLKETIPRKSHQHAEQLKKRRKHAAFSKSFKAELHTEDTPKPPPSLISKPEGFRETLVKSVINGALPKISSSESSSSLFNYKPKQSSSEKTSSLIIDAYNSIDAQLDNIIFRNENKVQDSSKITFTSWEEEFLKREIGSSDVETESIQSDQPVKKAFSTGFEWTPVINGTDFLNLKPIKPTSGSLKALKHIINRQKKLHEEIQSQSAADRMNSKFNENSTVAAANEHEFKSIVQADVNEDTGIKPPPIRKKCLVTSIPKYRGFSTPGSVPITRGRRKLKQANKFHPDTSMRLGKEAKPARKIPRDHSKVLPINKFLDENLSLKSTSHSKQIDTKLSSTDSDISGKENVESPDKISPRNGENVHSNQSVSSSNHSEKENISLNVESLSKNENSQKKKPDKDSIHNLNLSSDDDSSSSHSETDVKGEKEKEILKPLTVTKGIKRKAFKIQEEQMIPSPKVRHYDAPSVRDYIRKKKAERRKRHQDERKKSAEEKQKKKENLQKLYQFQKQTISSPTIKAMSPAKVCKKPDVFINKDSKLSDIKDCIDFQPKQESEKLSMSPVDETQKTRHPLPNEVHQHSRSKEPSQNSSEKPTVSSPDAKIVELNHHSSEQNNSVKLPGSSEQLIPDSPKQKCQTNDVNREKNLPTFEDIASQRLGTAKHEPQKLTSVLKNDNLSSFADQSSNALSFLSTLSTPSDSSQLSSFERMLPRGIKQSRAFPSVKSKETETLKNLVKSIEEMTAPFEHLMRTRVWVEQSPPPPNVKPPTKHSSSTSSHPEIQSKTLKEVSTDFVMNVAKSLHTTENNSFRQQVLDVGDTSQLYETILGHHADAQKKDNVYYENNSKGQGSINKVVEPEFEYSLIEGSLESEDELAANENEPNLLVSNQKGTSSTVGNQIMPVADILSFNPDPFNLINTWNRKPLGIPEFSNIRSNSPVLDPQKQNNEPQAESVIQNNLFMHKNHTTDSSIDGKKTSQSRESFLSTAISSSLVFSHSGSSSFTKHRDDVSISYLSNESINKKEESTSQHSENTLVQTDYSSVVSESNSEVSNSKSSADKTVPSTSSVVNGIVEQAGIQDTNLNGKSKSRSESSISEIISVIETGNEKPTVPEHKGDDFQEIGISDDIFQVKEGSITELQETSSRTTLIRSDYKNSAESSIQESIVYGSPRSAQLDDDKSSIATSAPKSANGIFSSPENIQEVSNESVPNVSGDLMEPEKSEAASSVLSSKKELRSSALTPHKQDNVAGISAASQNNLVKDFAPLGRFSHTGDVPTSVKVHTGVTMHEEEYLHTQVVTRLASEAAAAAATSAVIAVFETQKELLNREWGATNFQVPLRSVNKISEQDKGENTSSQKSSSNNSVSTTIKSRSLSEDTIVDEVDENIRLLNTVKEVSSNDLNEENENVSELAFLSNHTSASTVISEDIADFKDPEVSHKKSHYKKILGNLSSPSPASLSESDSISDDTLISHNSDPSNSTLNESVHSDDSYAQLTLDVVRKMTHEERLRAAHQLAYLKSQEKTLVENARARMSMLESLKKKLQEKGAAAKASIIKRKQKDLLFRLRQERAQLRDMQETYRNICAKDPNLRPDMKKRLNEPSPLVYHGIKKKEKFHSSKHSTEHRSKDIPRQNSVSSSTSAVLTEEELKDVDNYIPEVVPEMIKTARSNSSQGSIVETIASEQAKPASNSISSYNKSNKFPSSSPSFIQPKQGHIQSSPLHNNHSVESALQGLKKLEASKRHLTKREQRILQRRKEAEGLLQWKMKLDSAEMEVRELEQKAVELVDGSKKKTKYYMSSSPSAVQEESEKSPIEETPGTSGTGNMNDSASPSSVPMEQNASTSVPESLQSGSVPEESTSRITSSDSVEEEWSQKGSNGHSTNALSSSPIPEIEDNQSVESSIKTAEDTGESSHADEVQSNGISPSLKTPVLKKSGSDVYSESFESTASQKTSSPTNDSSIQKTSTPLSASKKERGISIKSPLAPLNMKRHDSSGSDDSYTISHSETASDQSDIEVRIHALAEELKRRKYEAEKLKRQQKRKYREHLKGTELSLQKQVEVYNQYIQRVKSDLEQIEAASLNTQSPEISPVKPQIKWPRPEHPNDSRRIRKQSTLSSDTLILEKKFIDNASSSPDSTDSSLDISHKRGKLLMKKLYTDPKNLAKPEISPNKEDRKDHLKTSTVHTSPPTTDTGSKKTLTGSDSPNTSTEISSDVKTLLDTADASQKSSTESRDENVEKTDSFKSSNSLIITVDSTSDKSKIASISENAKVVYHSDTFISNSAAPQKNEEVIDKQINSNQALNTLPSLDENASGENSLDFTEEMTSADSNKSPRSMETITFESVHSSETEHSSEAYSNVNAGSIKEDLESGSFECGNSDGCLTPSPKKSADKELPIERLIKTSSPEHDKLLCQEDKSAIYEKKSVQSNSGSFQSLSLQESLKSETFVANVVNCLYSSVFDDAVRILLNISRNSNGVTKASMDLSLSLPQKSNYFTKFSVKKLNEKSVENVTNHLLNICLGDAISSITDIANSFNKLSANGSDVCPKSTAENGEESCTIDGTVECLTEAPVESTLGVHKGNEDIYSVIAVQDKNENNIFKKQINWLEDGFVSADWDAQQLEQQILLQQYPYYYRKIPNKPPPPYTPPASVGGNAQFNFPLPIRREKPVEKVDPIKYLTKHITPILSSIADTLLDGRQRGLTVSQIPEPDFSSIVEHFDLTEASQLTFLDLVFDLTKEITLDIYKETLEVPQPWLRPRKLTPKPLFPSDKNKLVSALQKEMEKALKLLPTESFAEQKKKRPTWSTMKLGRKKRDFVDTIIISEIREEEPDWVNYDQDEVTVKFQIADSIFDILVDDTVNLIREHESNLFR